jgi:hypothetical protein
MIEKVLTGELIAHSGPEFYALYILVLGAH